jgi:hypothetical protein
MENAQIDEIRDNNFYESNTGNIRDYYELLYTNKLVHL